MIHLSKVFTQSRYSFRDDYLLLFFITAKDGVVLYWCTDAWDSMFKRCINTTTAYKTTRYDTLQIIYCRNAIWTLSTNCLATTIMVVYLRFTRFLLFLLNTKVLRCCFYTSSTKFPCRLTPSHESMLVWLLKERDF